MSAHESDDGLWAYNAQDCVVTRECGEVIADSIKRMNLSEPDAFQNAMFYPVLRAMNLGLKIDPVAKKELTTEVMAAMEEREDFLTYILGHTLNPASHPQMTKLFYDDLKQPPIKTRAKKGVPGHLTCDDEALQRIGSRELLLRPIVNAIADIRTLGIFLKTFILAELDYDGRMRCSFNICGTKTYRLSSSKNAFGSGMNLMTVPSDKSKSVNKAANRASSNLISNFTLPNIRRLFIPDTGFTFFDLDLDRADLYGFVWEIDDRLYKDMLRKGVDAHLFHVYLLDGKEPPPLDELVESHPKYLDHRIPRAAKREFSKVFCHACLTKDHEVLTRHGWKRIDLIGDTEEIAVWNKDSTAISFEQPISWYRDYAKAGEDLVLLEGQSYDQVVTANHKMAYSTGEGYYRTTTAREVLGKSSARLPKSGLYSGPKRIDTARLITAFLADGSMDNYGNVYFHLKKERKKKRLRELLQGREYSEYTESFYVPHRSAETFTCYGREYGSWLLELCGENLDEIVDELVYWDSSYTKERNAIVFSSAKLDNLQWVRTLVHLRGKASQYQGSTISGFGSEVHRCSVNNRIDATLTSLRTKGLVKLEIDTLVYCPKTSTGFFMIRRNGKVSVSGNTDYCGSSRTVAAHTGRSVHEIDKAQRTYLGAHPKIEPYWARIQEQINKKGYVENKFSYRWHIFDRRDAVLPEAVAWIPQSTTGIVINKIWMNFHQHEQEIQTQLQVHDSLGGQFPTHRRDYLLPRMRELSKICVPYDDPLIIPVGIETSTTSWGDCK